jgi:hypothetical protein
MASTFATDADYQRLTAKEILAALPSIDAEDLDDLEVLERSGKNRVTVLRRIAALQAAPDANDAPPVAATDPDADEAAQPATPRTVSAGTPNPWAAGEFEMSKPIDGASNKPALPTPAGQTPMTVPASKGQVRKSFARRGGVQLCLVIVVIFAIGAWAIENNGSSNPSSAAETTIVTYPIIRTTAPGYDSYQTPTTVKALAPSYSTSFAGDSGKVPSKALAAFDVCKQFVRDQLKAPSGATWRNPLGNQVTYSGSGSGPWTVTASVDAQNSFGAKIRMDYICTVTNTSGDSWHLDSLVTS